MAYSVTLDLRLEMAFGEGLEPSSAGSRPAILSFGEDPN